MQIYRLTTVQYNIMFSYYTINAEAFPIFNLATAHTHTHIYSPMVGCQKR